MKGTPQHSATITKNKDGTLNYGVPHSMQRQAAAPGPRATTATGSAATAQGGR